MLRFQDVRILHYLQWLGTAKLTLTAIIKDELELHLSLPWLREHVPLNLLRYVNEAPLAMPLDSRNAITLGSLRNYHLQKTEALVIQVSQMGFGIWGRTNYTT